MAPNDEDSPALGRFLPREVNGWEASGRDETYDPESIFDYIDGAGEVYRAYNFQSLRVRRFRKQGQPAITVDFFDMESPADAFGVFTHDLEGERLAIGQGATYKGGLLSFWKGPYFVSVYAEGETPETKVAVLQLGRKIASAIPVEGEKPELLKLVPVAFSLDEARFFHTHLILNYHFFIASENILRLDRTTDALLVPFRSEAGKNRLHLLLIRYPDEGKQAQAYESFVRAYMPDASPPGFVRTEDETWTGIRPKKNYLFLVFHAPSLDQAESLLAEIEERVEALRGGQCL